MNPHPTLLHPEVRRMLLFVCCISLFVSTFAETTKPTISFTFDDGSTDNFPNYPLETWNQLLLSQMQKHGIKAILFSSGANKTSERGKYVLDSWDKAGHGIANHTFSHPNFNSKNTTLDAFTWELLHNDSIIRTYGHYLKFFRFPYLKEGNTEEKVNGFRHFMAEQGYKNGHVSIDASDWYVNQRLLKRLRSDSLADVSGYRTYYIEHLFNRAEYYESLSLQLTGRHIQHVVLLHHNLAAALFLDDLITHFKNKGWQITDAEKAYEDPFYNNVPTALPAGESLVWALAKASGKFETQLRYPAEDGEYEKEAMDKLGL